MGILPMDCLYSRSIERSSIPLSRQRHDASSHVADAIADRRRTPMLAEYRESMGKMPMLRQLTSSSPTLPCTRTCCVASAGGIRVGGRVRGQSLGIGSVFPSYLGEDF